MLKTSARLIKNVEASIVMMVMSYARSNQKYVRLSRRYQDVRFRKMQY